MARIDWGCFWRTSIVVPQIPGQESSFSCREIGLVLRSRSPADWPEFGGSFFNSINLNRGEPYLAKSLTVGLYLAHYLGTK